MSYYILDKCGNFISEYKTTLEIAKAFDATSVIFINCSNTISNLIKNKKPKTKVLSAKGVVCVKEKDYKEHLDSIIWILTKDDILTINKLGNIIDTHKTIKDAAKAFNISDKNISRILNKDKQYKEYRFVTREHYINTIRKDVLYYSKGIKELGKKRIPIDMYNFKTGDFIKSFDSLSDAAKYMGCSREAIRLALKEGRPILKTNYYFKKSDRKQSVSQS